MGTVGFLPQREPRSERLGLQLKKDRDQTHGEDAPDQDPPPRQLVRSRLRGYGVDRWTATDEPPRPLRGLGLAAPPPDERHADGGLGGKVASNLNRVSIDDRGGTELGSEPTVRDNRGTARPAGRTR